MNKFGAVSGNLLEQLRRLEESLWIADQRFDDAEMDQIFACDFVEIGRSGRIYTREQMLIGTEYAGTSIDAELPLANFKARYLADDIVQVTYVSRVTYDGEVEEGHRSSIWGLSDDHWLLRFHQGTPVFKD